MGAKSSGGRQSTRRRSQRTSTNMSILTDTGSLAESVSKRVTMTVMADALLNITRQDGVHIRIGTAGLSGMMIGMGRPMRNTPRVCDHFQIHSVLPASREQQYFQDPT